MAAERVLYGENTNGVGGDVQMATAEAALMVGAYAMAPEKIDPPGVYETEEEREKARKAIMEQFEEIGIQIVNRTNGSGPMAADPIGSVLADPSKRKLVAQLLGQAYLCAHLLMQHNKPAVDQVARAVMQRGEIYGDELLRLLDQQDVQVPQVDLTDKSVWPRL
jgi:hypothetical protein